MPTTIDELWKQTQVGSNSMSSVGSQLLGNFKASKEYRHAFVEEKVRTQLAIQIKSIREQREMSRPELAALMGKVPSWVFRLEDPNQAPPTISTLLQVAEAFDVDLDISFRRFSDLIDRIGRITPESFQVPSFEEEIQDETLDSQQSRAILREVRGNSVGACAIFPFPQSGTRSEISGKAGMRGRRMRAKRRLHPSARRVAA